MDQRQIDFVAAALRDELRGADVVLTPEQLSGLATAATKAALTWMIGAAQEGMIDSVHVDSERPE